MLAEQDVWCFMSHKDLEMARLFAYVGGRALLKCTFENNLLRLFWN